MYVIDSDVLIDAKNRHYGFDIVPAFWSWIEQQHREGRVFTVQRVADEVLAGADELADWMDAQPASFRLSAGPEDQPSLQAADYFLVAQALSRGFTVVTQEVPDPVVSRKRTKIPDSCKAVGVPWMTPFMMLRTEGARFSL